MFSGFENFPHQRSSEYKHRENFNHAFTMQKLTGAGSSVTCSYIDLGSVRNHDRLAVLNRVRPVRVRDRVRIRYTSARLYHKTITTKSTTFPSYMHAFLICYY